MSNTFGWTPATPEPAKPAEPARPVSVHELRQAIDLVDDRLLKASSGRTTFTAREVTDLLLDVRFVLDSLTSPSTLVAVAKELYAEARAFGQELRDAQG